MIWQENILEWPTSAWDKCERYSVDAFFQEWTRKLRTLDWLPWRNERGWQMEGKVEYNEAELADPDSPTSKSIQAKLEVKRKQWQAAGMDPEPIEHLYPGYLTAHKAAHNRYWAKRRMYTDCGWPENFDQDQFVKLQDEFNARAAELGALDGPSAEQAEMNKELREFYKVWAGQHAV